MFRGLAIGGPLDGKVIECEGPYYKVAEEFRLEPFVKLEDVISNALAVHDVFEYRHYETPGGDVFIPSAVIARKLYDHKIWDHPLEYVFAKLIKAYRPNGY